MYLCSMDKGKTWTKLSDDVFSASVAAHEMAKSVLGQPNSEYYMGHASRDGLCYIVKKKLELKLFTFINAGPMIYIWADSYEEALEKTPFRQGDIPFEVRIEYTPTVQRGSVTLD